MATPVNLSAAEHALTLFLSTPQRKTSKEIIEFLKKNNYEWSNKLETIVKTYNTVTPVSVTTKATPTAAQSTAAAPPQTPEQAAHAVKVAEAKFNKHARKQTEQEVDTAAVVVRGRQSTIVLTKKEAARTQTLVNAVAQAEKEAEEAKSVSVTVLFDETLDVGSDDDEIPPPPPLD